MKKFYLFCSGLLLMTLVACSEPKVDTSSVEAFAKSIQTINDSISESERQEFFKSMMMIVDGKPRSLTSQDGKVMTYKDMAGAYAMALSFGGKKASEAFDKLNGLTVGEVIEQGKKIVKAATEKKNAE